jgi:hypothetical protein
MLTVLKANADPVWFARNILEVEPFPAQADILRTFYGYGGGKVYKKFIGACGMRSGKSALAAMIGAYEYFKLTTMEDPAKYWGLLNNQRINISIVATSSTQAEDSVYSNTQEFIENGDFFNTWIDTRFKDMQLYNKKNNVMMRVLSSWASSAVGRSNKAVIFDELANFEETAGKRGAFEVYSRLSKSTDTFHLDGKIIAISSLKHPNDIMMQNYRNGLNEKHTLALLKPTWEMNPNFSKEQLMEEYKFDMTSFWRDYACQPQAVGSNEFPEGVKLNDGMTNVFESEHFDKGIPYDKIPRVCSIDPAVTNDYFGVACGYRTHTGKIIIDGVHKFEKFDGDIYIKPSEVQDFIKRGIRSLNFYALVFDTWMYPDLVEMVEDQYGLDTEKHITNKETYDSWREKQGAQTVEIVHNDFLQREVNNLLVINDKRVDHPRSGSKDVADAVCNAIWFLDNYDGDMEYIPRTPVGQIKRY